jgi:hypothetical protein
MALAMGVGEKTCAQKRFKYPWLSMPAQWSATTLMANDVADQPSVVGSLLNGHALSAQHSRRCISSPNLMG